MKFIHFIKLNSKKIWMEVSTALFLGTGVIAALAQAASTSEAVNLRYGPGVQYYRITTLPSGASVHIDYCRGGWCQIRTSWGIGWVNSRYLVHGSKFAAKESRDDLVQTPATPEAKDGAGNNNNDLFYDRYYHSYYRLYDGYWYYLGRKQGYQPDYWFYDPYYRWRK